MGTVFAEMSSWIALTWYTVMKTAFNTKNMKSESYGIFIVKKILRMIKEYANLKKYSIKQLIKLGFSYRVVNNESNQTHGF